MLTECCELVVTETVFANCRDCDLSGQTETMENIEGPYGFRYSVIEYLL